MPTLAWSWLATPYVVCAVAITAVGLAASLIRGDRVLRLGMIGATASALPWAVCSAIAACTTDAELATRVLRIGVGPVALVGPDLLLVLLGVSGQLERHRWLARIAATGGGLLLAACWLTDWTVPGVRMLPSGIFYMTPGPLTGIHMAQLAAWLIVGVVLARRATPSAERRRMVRLLLIVIGLGAVGGSDSLILYDIVGSYPIAWLPIGTACFVVLYLVARTDILRPRGFDRGALIEIAGFVVATAAIGCLAFAEPDARPLPFAAVGSVIWVIATASAWAAARRWRAPLPAGTQADDLVAALGDLGDEGAIAERLGEAWRAAVGIEPVAIWLAGDSPDELAPLYGGQRWRIEPEVMAWLARLADPLAVGDLATMRLGALRGPIEALGAAHGASLIVPLVDRGALVGVIEALYDRALREGERGFVATSARAAARQLTFVRLSREAAREGETAREVEVAEAMRMQASASRDDALGRWAVVAEYRSATRAGTSWAASLLDDGRLALLVTETPGAGLVAALGTAALTGAFAAATTGPSATTGAATLDDLLAALRASADGVIRGGEPVAAFVAILDADGRLDWGSADHPGAHVVDGDRVVALGGGGNKLGASLTVATRGRLQLAPSAMLVVASSALRGDDDDAWTSQLRELAPAGGKLAALAVAARKARDEDLLAVVVRRRI